MARPTIADVAAAAGVSKSTVSRVLNGNVGYMREATLTRVQEIIAALGYRPNSVARSLTLKRTQTVGLLISDIGNPFYPEVILGVEKVATAHHYEVFLCNTMYDLQRSLSFARSLVDKQVDGALIMSSNLSDEALLALEQHALPTVVLDWELDSGSPHLGVISVDFETGITAAANHLVDLGHRRLAHVSGPLQLRTARLRRDAFLSALAARGFDPASIPIVEGNLAIDGGKAAFGDLCALPEMPTAVFAANDLTAIGLVWAARKHGLRVPEDLSIIGLDDIQLASEIEPPLTTVTLHPNRIGCTAMEMLLKLMAGCDEETRTNGLHTKVDTQLIVRQSTAPYDPQTHHGTETPS